MSRVESCAGCGARSFTNNKCDYCGGKIIFEHEEEPYVIIQPNGKYDFQLFDELGSRISLEFMGDKTTKLSTAVYPHTTETILRWTYNPSEGLVLTSNSTTNPDTNPEIVMRIAFASLEGNNTYQCRIYNGQGSDFTPATGFYTPPINIQP